MQTILIAGATSGIGLRIANILHNDGFKVYGTSRFPDKHKDMVSFDLLPLDITSNTSIENCIGLLLTKSTTIDVL